MSDEKPFHNPFEALRALRDTMPPAPDRPSPEAAQPSPEATQAATIPRAVVRMERSGRGGKQVTVIEQLGLAPGDRETWLKALKSALGCGGAVEGELLVLQGDQRERVATLLRQKGVRRVVAG